MAAAMSEGLARFWHSETEAEAWAAARAWANNEADVALVRLAEFRPFEWADFAFVLDHAYAGLDGRTREAVERENDRGGRCDDERCRHQPCAARRVAVKRRAREARIVAARREDVVLDAALDVLEQTIEAAKV